MKSCPHCRSKVSKLETVKVEKALEEACKNIADAAEPNCGNCPLEQKGECPNGEEMTDRCWEFIRHYFVEKCEAK